MPHSFEEVCGAVARGWCSPRNATKEMDADLATDIAKEVWKLLHEPPKVYQSHGEEAERALERVRNDWNGQR